MLRPQRLTWWCGVASAANALACLGIERDQEDLATLCHVTRKDGTDEDEVMRALLACGAKVAPWYSRHRLRSMQWLQSTLHDHGPAILCVDQYQHWVTVIGSLNQTTFWVFDPAADMGLQMYGWDELVARWRKAKPSPRYYGIGVSR
jgi:ABC-type bacteriocin/lantibiotic exporter with double-glycine peptidase domain